MLFLWLTLRSIIFKTLLLRLFLPHSFSICVYTRAAHLIDFSYLSPLGPCRYGGLFFLFLSKLSFATFPPWLLFHLSLHWSRSLKISHLLHPSPPSHHVRHTSPKRPAEFDIKPTPAGEARKNGTKRVQLPRVSLNHSLLTPAFQPTNQPTHQPIPAELNTSLSASCLTPNHLQGPRGHNQGVRVTRKAQKVWEKRPRHVRREWQRGHMWTRGCWPESKLLNLF